jgi:hypothetical protein
MGIKTLSKWQKRDCDRCGFTFYKHELVRDKGLLVCKPCVDGPYQNSKVPWRFGGKQPAGAKNVITITASITRSEEHMLIVGSGAVTITGANITAATDNQRMVLEGTSDTNTVTLVQDSTLNLWEGQSFTLKNGDVICLVYSNGVWTETSRSWYYTRNVGGHYG